MINVYKKKVFLIETANVFLYVKDSDLCPISMNFDMTGFFPKEIEEKERGFEGD